MSRVVAVLGVFILLFAGLYGLSAHYEATVTESNNQTEITNETFTVQEGELHEFSESRRDVIYNDTVEVYQNGSEIQSNGGDNWEWRGGTGTLYVPNGSELVDGDDASITYRFTEPTSEQQVAKDVTMQPFRLGEGLTLIGGIVLLLLAVALAGRQR